MARILCLSPICETLAQSLQLWHIVANTLSPFLFLANAYQLSDLKVLGVKLFMRLMLKGGKIHYYQNIRDFVADIHSTDSQLRQLAMDKPLFHDQLWDLMCKLLVMDPPKRLTAAKAFFHPFCQVGGSFFCFLTISLSSPWS